MNIAIEALEKARKDITDRYEREVAEINAAIAELGKQPGAEPTSGQSAPKIRPGQFSGMEAATALQVYLSDRGGGPVSLEQATREMRAGGLKPDWSDQRYPRNVKIMLNNGRNREIFRYDERSDAVELIKKPR